ncbi:NTP transferase domain-containing protein [Plantactinospora sp. WMMC1484]|uniref:molybdenum cofactor guanylyltransferase n=1 Tax=Plantactinospora sp. WMMC1484 TaxID=3404122 RepID=UPI003BF5AE72
MTATRPPTAAESRAASDSRAAPDSRAASDSRAAPDSRAASDSRAAPGSHAGFAAVVLAGGAARRMGGTDKPALPVAGRSMLERVLAAVADADPRIVVGAAAGLPAGVRATREQPPGGGPVAALAAGLAQLPAVGTGSPLAVALLAADLPLLTSDAVRQLRTALSRASRADGVVFVDESGRAQFLCGVWRPPPLRAALARLAAGRNGVLTGTSMRALVAELAVTEVSWRGTGPPPWFDCDTEDDVRRAEEWIR